MWKHLNNNVKIVTILFSCSKNHRSGKSKEQSWAYTGRGDIQILYCSLMKNEPLLLTLDTLVFHLEVITELIWPKTLRHKALHHRACTGRVSHTCWPIIDQIHGIINAVPITECTVTGWLPRAWGTRHAGVQEFPIFDRDSVERLVYFNHFIRFTLETDLGYP